MIGDVVAAQLSGNAYAASPDVASAANEIVLPGDWQIAQGENARASGFLARAYTDGTQLVVAFGGTTGEFHSRIENFARDWLQGNLPAAGGLILAPQVLAAARFYLDLISNPAYASMPVTFTGHSLGGGLAALMSVYFDKPAVTFDAAPFLRHADSLAVATQLKAALLAAGYSVPSAFASYVAIDPTGALLASPSRLLRDDQVRHVFVTGEALSVVPSQLLAAFGLANPFVPTGKIVGTERALDPQAQTTPTWGLIDRAVDLHSQTLLTAFVSSASFLEAVRSQAGLLPAVFGSALMSARPPSGVEPRLLESLVNRQLAGLGSLDVLTQDVAIIMSSGTAGAPAMNAAMYHAALGAQFAQANDSSATREFTALAGGVQFLLKGHSDLNEARLRLYEATVSLTGLEGQTGHLAALRQGEWRWTVQSGDGALAAHGTGDKRDAMLGGEGGDSLAGEGSPDLLIGGSGADTLDGGAGNDTLIGGTGADLYQFTGTFGHDTIEDSDGAGRIEVDGNALPAGKKIPGQSNAWVSDDSDYTYVFAPAVSGGSTGTLYILKTGSADTITVRNYTIGQLGITLSDTQASLPPPENTFTGDFVKALDPSGSTYLRDGINYVPDPNGVPGPQPDLFFGSAGVDRFELGGGNDAAGGGGGEDWIDGGDNDDLLLGGSERDTIVGGTGNDYVFGSHYGSNWAAPISPNSPQPVAYGPERARGFGWVVYDPTAPDSNGLLGWMLAGVDMNLVSDDAGNFLDGGAGNDWIFAGSGDDLARGGADDDELRGMGGNDRLFGENGADVLHGDGIVLAGYLESTPADKHGDDVLDGGTGDDILKGQGGADVLIGGADDDLLWGDDSDVRHAPVAVHGDDRLYGDSGNDQLIGGGGADELYGGSENDLLVGDDDAATLAGQFHGNDYLDGEGGNDQLVGNGGDDVLYGGTDNDGLFGDAMPAELAGVFHGSDHLDGEGGDDYLEGGGKDDVLLGGADNDMLWGDSPQPGLATEDLGNDYLDGGDGNDNLIGGGKDDTLFGGGGNDQLRGDGSPAKTDPAASGADYLDGGAGDDLLFGDGGSDVLYGGADNDQLLGDATDVPAQYHGDDFLDGEDGNDVLVGGGGNDVLYGGAGIDFMFGDTSDGALEATAHGDDFLDGGSGDDVMTGDGGADTLLGGAGNDQILGDNAGSVVDIAVHGADVIDGGDGDDLIIGDGGGDTLFGNIGNDQLYGDGDASHVVVAAHGADTIDGGDGDDLIAGDGAGDTLSGGEGNDTLYGDGRADRVPEEAHGNDVIDAGAGNDAAFGGGGDDTINGGDGDDWLKGDDATLFVSAAAHGNDVVDGGAGNDIIEGGGGADRLYGGDGSDMLLGDYFVPVGDPLVAHGDDLLDGGGGDDNLEGSGGNDTLIGGLGNDYIIGGAGDDTYVFNRGDGADTLDNTDASGGVDTLRFGAGIAPDDIEGQRAGSSLRLIVAGTADRITIADWYLADSVNDSGQTVTHKLDRVEFADGTVWTTAMIEASLTDPLVLQGGPGPDVLVGGGGDDTLYGSGGDDELIGGRGDDTLDGGPGADLMMGGVGEDLYLVENAADTVVETLTGSSGWGDTVDATISYALPRGVETIRMNPPGSGGEFIATGNALNNWFRYEPSGSYYASVSIYGLAGNDSLRGSYSADTLYGGTGNDTLDASGGADRMYGGPGDDEYFVETAGDQVNEQPGEGYDSVTSFISYQLPANVEALSLSGTNSASLSGGGNALDNYIAGSAGSLVLTGGKGNDFVVGASGSTTYMFNVGDGRDVIHNDTATGTDKLLLGAGITPADVAFNRVESGLLMSIFGGADSVFFQWWFEGATIDTIQFSSGQTWSTTQIEAMVGASLTNNAPQVLLPQPVTITAYEGQEISFVFPQGAVVDTDPWDATGFVFYMMSEQDSISSLSSIDLDELGQVNGANSGPFGFVGTPNYGLAGTYEFRAEWRDIFEVTASIPVTITILPALPNRAPERIGSLQDLTITETSGPVSLGPIAALISDPDGDPLVYTVAQGDGTPLPAWLAVGPATASSGEWRVQVTAGRIEGETSIPVRIVASDDSGTRSEPLAFNVSVLIEDLVLNGTSDVDSLAGGSGSDQINGLAGNDFLWGYAGDDLLDGGPGSDRMYGGLGNDTYVVDSTSDFVDETTYNPGSGHDLVLSKITFTLPTGIEDLALTGTSSISGTGNASDNVLTGNSANNTLTGKEGNDVLDGGAGADKLIGGPGDDRYLVDATGDAITELANEGTDSVEASVTYTLANNVENLTLTGSATINGTGNALPNRITGNAAANVLNGGLGADRMVGGLGDDTYVVDNAADEIVENVDEGNRSDPGRHHLDARRPRREARTDRQRRDQRQRQLPRQRAHRQQCRQYARRRRRKRHAGRRQRE